MTILPVPLLAILPIFAVLSVSEPTVALSETIQLASPFMNAGRLVDTCRSSNLPEDRAANEDGICSGYIYAVRDAEIAKSAAAPGRGYVCSPAQYYNFANEIYRDMPNRSLSLKDSSRNAFDYLSGIIKGQCDSWRKSHG